MSTSMLCPDCGGIIGATQVTDEGRPCTCFAAASDPARINSDSTAHAASLPDSRSGEKTCCKCGADVTGQKRYRDENGYWCAQCHRADKADGNLTRVRCSECNRVVPEESLIDYEGMRICTRCHRERRELARKKKKFRPTAYMGEFQRMEQKRLYILLGVFFVLLLIIILHQLGILGGGE